MAAVAAVGISAIAVYRMADPSTSWWMPQCPFLRITGLMCPGCGAQRALHALLQGDVAAAFRFNPFLLTIVPLAGIFLLLRGIATGRRRQAIDRHFTTKRIFYFLAMSTMAWWIIRNIFYHQ